jgi:hypothetical protein
MRPPTGLESRGQELWEAAVAASDFDAAGLVLLGEACRTADIIERLSAALKSNSSEWVRLSEEAEVLADGAAKIQIVVNPLLGEVRQQRIALRTMLAHLKLGKVEETTGEDSPIAKLMAAFNLE